MNYVKYAQNFISKVEHLIHVNINVMNDKGIIIASTDMERIGDFHALAYSMIKNNTEIQPISNVDENPNLIGVKPGINILLKRKFVPYGVIGLTGNPEEITELAKLLKLAFESLIKFEDSYLKTKSLGDFAYSLIFDDPPRLSRIKRLAKINDLIIDIPRLPILFYFEKSTDSQLFYDSYYKMQIYSYQDMIFPIEHNQVLLFKNLGSYDHDYKAVVNMLLKEVDLFITSSNTDFSIYTFCGIPQRNILSYAKSYEQLLIMQDNTDKIPIKTLHIDNYLLEVLMSSDSPKDINNLLDYYKYLLEEHYDLSSFITTIGALVNNNMNYDDSSKALFMHKNTIIARMNRIKDILHIDPFKNKKDMVLLNIIYNYIK